MKKTVLVYGLISGSIVAAVILLSIPLWQKGILNFDNGQLTGYTSMVIALSMVFFGIKSYRDNQLGGAITFGKAFQIGILITLIAAVMYALAWEVSLGVMGEEFSEQMTNHYFEELKAGGATAAELEEARKQWADFEKMYQNFFVRFGITLLEIIPVGLIITLISAGLLRKKEFLPRQINS
jgi:hypothetical protein